MYGLAAAAIVGAAVSAYGAVKQGQYAKASADYNAEISARDALAAKQKAEYDADTSALKFKQLLGKQRALYAKAGVDITEGSPLLMMSFQAEQAERDKQAILYGGKTQSQSDLDRANLFRMSGANSQTAGYISGGSTFLSGLANAGTYSKGNTKTYSTFTDPKNTW
jgi:hypothetical protein